MYDRFNKLSFWSRIIVVMIVLFFAWLILQLVLGLVKALIPLAFIAAIIVGILWLFEQVRDSGDAS
jgi:hypothetical protein